MQTGRPWKYSEVGLPHLTQGSIGPIVLPSGEKYYQFFRDKDDALHQCDDAAGSRRSMRPMGVSVVYLPM